MLTALDQAFRLSRALPALAARAEMVAQPSYIIHAVMHHRRANLVIGNLLADTDVHKLPKELSLGIILVQMRRIINTNSQSLIVPVELQHRSQLRLQIVG